MPVLRKFAPEKRPETIRATMAQVRLEGEAAKDVSHTGKQAAAFCTGWAKHADDHRGGWHR